MGRVHIVTDSTADLPPGAARQEGLDITTIPLNVHFGSETYRDGVDIDHDEFFRRLTRSTIFPTTSQPAVGLFVEAYQRLLQPGDHILSLHISSLLSGTYQAAVLAANSVSVPPGAITAVDTRSGSMGLGLIVIAAARLARDGAPLDAILERVQFMCSHMHVYFTVDTLDYLQRGGRIGRAQALIGSLLNVKPILALDDGLVVPLRRERTRRRALDALVELACALPSIAMLAIVQRDVEGDAVALIDRIRERVLPRIPDENIFMSQFGPTVGTHLGPGGIGVIAVEQWPEP